MKRPLNIAFLWHMHQPLYKDPFTGEYILPWVLFHGTKDYLTMVSLLNEFPSIHQTFNLVPSLIEQLKDYASGEPNDRYRKVSSRDASLLTKEEKLLMLERFFQANWDTMVKPVERYWELLKKRGFSASKEDIEESFRYFTAEDFLDLQLLFNLAWMDPGFAGKDPELSFLVKKGRNYTEEDKKTLLSKHIYIIPISTPKSATLIPVSFTVLTASPYY